MRFRRRLTNAVAFCAWLIAPAWGQNSAEVRGKVTDASHKPVVSAFLIITAQDTSFMRAETTDDAGEFKWDDDGRIRLHQPSLKKLACVVRSRRVCCDDEPTRA
jgi:hypothetical protein